MGQLKEIVIDCDFPSTLARFWASVLDGYQVMPYDDDEIARLGSLGLTPETDTNVMVVGPGTRLCFHLRQGERPTRNRIHFDVAADEQTGEIERLMLLGAQFVREGDGYTVLRDPEGNNFCVTSF